MSVDDVMGEWGKGERGREGEITSPLSFWYVISVELLVTSDERSVYGVV